MRGAVGGEFRRKGCYKRACMYCKRRSWGVLEWNQLRPSHGGA